MFRAEVKLVNANEKSMSFSAKCPFCGKVNTLVLPNTEALRNGLVEWKKGSLVQNVFPFLTADQREFFITGNCSCIWG